VSAAKKAAAKKAPAKASVAAKAPTPSAAGATAGPAATYAPTKAPTQAAATKAPAEVPSPVVEEPAVTHPESTTTPAKAPARAAKAPAKAAAKAVAKAVAETPLTGDDAWTKKELADIRKLLEAEARDLRGEIDDAEEQTAALKRDSGGEGTGDEADAGSKTFEREHEMSLANNSRDLLLQVERALARLDAGTYGRCENCGKPIPKARLQALPAATMDVACKQREERR
jgi:RNA polymerase-binding protein DksA